MHGPDQITDLGGGTPAPSQPTSGDTTCRSVGRLSPAVPSAQHHPRKGVVSPLNEEAHEIKCLPRPCRPGFSSALPFIASLVLLCPHVGSPGRYRRRDHINQIANNPIGQSWQLQGLPPSTNRWLHGHLDGHCPDNSFLRLLRRVSGIRHSVSQQWTRTGWSEYQPLCTILECTGAIT